MWKFILVVLVLYTVSSISAKSATPKNVTKINFNNGQEVEDFIAKDDSPIQFVIFFKYSNRDQLIKRTLEASGREKSKAGNYFTFEEVQKLIAMEEKDRETLYNVIDQLQGKIIVSNHI
eukprot:Awhi_evm1s15752